MTILIFVMTYISVAAILNVKLSDSNFVRGWVLLVCGGAAYALASAICEMIN